MKRIADSSFLLAFFDRNDDRRPQAKAFLEDPQPILVPQEVASETLSVIQRRFGHEDSVRFWGSLLALPNIQPVPCAPHDGTFARFRKAPGTMSFVDAAVVEHCVRRGARPLCFDSDIDQAVRAG